MKQAIGRRSLLGLMAAAPVIAREATAKVVGNHYGAEIAQSMGVSRPVAADNEWEKSWVKDKLKSLASGERRRELAREFARISSFDPDIASMRSISLSAAVHMQRERNIDRHLADERERHYQRAMELFGVQDIASFIHNLESAE